MALSRISSQVASQASTQIAAQMSLLLLRKTLELQAASIAELVQPAAPAQRPRQSAQPGQKHRRDGLMPREERLRSRYVPH